MPHSSNGLVQPATRDTALIDRNRTAKELKQAIPYVTAYVFVWSYTYLYNYWSAFNVDPTSYISFNEIIFNASSIISIASYYALAILAIEAVAPKILRDDYSKENETQNNVQLVIYLVVGALTIGAFFLWGHKYEFLSVATYSTMITAARPLSLTTFYQKSFSSYPIRVAVAAFTIFLPIFAIVSPATKVSDILSRKGEQEIVKRPSGLCREGCIMIGRLGDYFVVLDKSNISHMIKNDEMTVFSISRQTLN